VIARHWRKVLLFGGIGLTVFMVGQALLLGLVEFARWNEFVANALQLVVTLGLNFLLNSWITWRDRTRGWREFVKFTSSRVVTLLLSFAVFSVLVGVFGWHYLVANLVGVAVGMALNYAIGEVWVFKRIEGW
jgi:putative flippase GtrA